MDNDIKQLLESIYFEPSNEGSFGGVQRLYKKAKTLQKTIQKHDIIKFLKNQDAYTHHKDIIRKFPRQAVIVSGIDSQWQADLVVLPDLIAYNDGYVNILTVIDIFSKYAWAIPLKDKTANGIIKAFHFIFSTSNRKPQKLQTDKGTEFINESFKNFLQTNGVQFFTTESELKASVVERFNRTLKTRMWRYFNYKNTKRYIDVLDLFLES